MRRNAFKLNPRVKPNLRVKPLLIGLTAALGAGIWAGSAAPTQAHGAKIEVLPQAVEIVATFDTGEPMDNAQVGVYAPDMPNTPWQTGQTDSEGRFSFTPDADMGGLWEVTVRKAGHGQTTSFALGGEAGTRAITTSTQSPATQSAVQKWLSMGGIVWGFVGTALYFSNKTRRGKSTTQPAVEPALGSAQTGDSRAAVEAGFRPNKKANAEESR